MADAEKQAPLTLSEKQKRKAEKEKHSCWASFCTCLKMPLVFLTICNVINFVGFLTPGWAKANYGVHWIANDEWRPPHEEGPPMGFGLWYVCTGNESCQAWNAGDAALNAARAFATIGLILLLLAEIFLALYYYSAAYNKSTSMVMAVCAAVASGATCMLLAAGSYGAFLAGHHPVVKEQWQDIDVSLDYSYGCCVSAAVLSIMDMMFFFMGHYT